MGRYHFDVRDSGGFHRDDIGCELDSFDCACQQAQSLLPDIARAELPDGDFYTISCEVRDEAGRVVYRGTLTYVGTRFRPSDQPVEDPLLQCSDAEALQPS